MTIERAMDVTKAFEDRGEYYRNNSNAGFKATVAETISENANCKKRGYKRVAIFHTHLRHPAYFDEIMIKKRTISASK